MNKLSFLYRVLKKPKYLLTLALGLTGFYLLNAFIANIQNIWNFGSQASLFSTISYTGTLIQGFSATMLPSMFITLLITGTLMGTLFALLHYQYTLTQKNSVSHLAKVGIFLGTVAPGCAACCGIGLAAALGIGTAFAALPFQGKEISYIVIGILCFSIYRTLGRLTKECNV